MNRIVDVEPIYLRYPFPEGIRYVYSGGVVENMDAALVRITCGAMGYSTGLIH